MIKRKVDKFWFPWWPEKWLWGTIRIECTPAERGIWVDLLSLASKDDGHIRANEETPYPIKQLAGMLVIPEKEFEAAINKFIKIGKLTKTKTETLYVNKWDKYQFSERHRRRIEEEKDFDENKLTQKIIKELDSQDPPIQHETQKIIKDGRIDVFIPEPYVAIIELKNDSSADNIQRAIGQLLIYKNEYPKSMLFIATPEPMNNKTLNKIAGFNIRQWDLKSMILACDVQISGHSMTKKPALNNNILNNNTLNNNKEEQKTFTPTKAHTNITIEESRGISSLLADVVNIGEKKVSSLLEFLKELSLEFPDIDYVEEIKKKCLWWRDHPLTKKSNIHLQLRNWFKLAKKFQKESDQEKKVGESTHISSEKEDDYVKARAIKMKELEEKYQPEMDKAVKTKNREWIDEIDNKIKEEIAEFSREYHSKEGK